MSRAGSTLSLSLSAINPNHTSDNNIMHYRASIKPEIMASNQLRLVLHQQPPVGHVQPGHNQARGTTGNHCPDTQHVWSPQQGGHITHYPFYHIQTEVGDLN